MKKKTQTFSKDLRMPRLFRDDLMAIEGIIKNELNASGYKLETKDYEYDKVESIPSDIQPVVDFHIQTQYPYISIDLNRFSAKIYAGDDDLNTRGALAKIIEILSKTERKVLYWSQRIAIWFAPTLFFAPIIIPLIPIEGVRSTKYLVAFCVSLLAAIWWMVSFYSAMYKFSVVNFVSYKERIGFLKRNQDQIILLVLGAVTGTLLTVLGTFVSGRF